MTVLTQARLKEVLHYDPASGAFTWLKAYHSNRIGTRAGSDGCNAYWTIRIGNQGYLAHRLAWLYMTGSMPKLHLDHVNRDKLDNRFANLREATRAQNKANSAVRTDCKLGIKGVRKQRNKYRARISYQGKVRHIGYYDTPEEANAAYLIEATRQFGEFANGGTSCQ